MNKKIIKSVLAGMIGTAIMSLVMIIAPMMGIPKMSTPDMLAIMMGLPIWTGWVMHFMIGIVFAAVYVYLFASKLNISNLYVKGAILVLSYLLLRKLC